MASWTRTGTGGLFAMAEPRGGRHPVEIKGTTYAVIDLETTGLAAAHDRVVEVAVVRVRADGTVESEFSSLIDAGCDVGPSWIHHITNEAIAGAPSFADVAGELMARLEGAVVVAHNAVFEEGFLSAELARAGVRVPSLPALCTLTLSHWVDLPVPNHRLTTCCDHFGVGLTDAHTALGDSRATAQVLAHILRLADERGVRHLGFGAPLRPLPTYPLAVPPRHRVSNLRKGDRGWMANVVAKLPVVADEADPAAADAYLDLLADAVADGKIVGDEAKALARLAGRAGIGATQLVDLHRRFLDGLRDVAAADDHISRVEHRDLTRIAGLLGEPEYFADLVCDEPEAARSRSGAQARPSGPLAGVRVLFVGTSPSVEAVRWAAEAAGAASARNVTRSLRLVVHEGDGLVDGNGADPISDRRIDRARALGIATATPDAAWAALGLEPELSAATNGCGERDEPAVPDGSGAAVAVGDIRLADEGSTPEVDGPSGPAPWPAPPPPTGWYQDPSLRFTHRYWNGDVWTHWVELDGEVLEDPVPAA